MIQCAYKIHSRKGVECVITAKRPAAANYGTPHLRRIGRRMLNDWQIYALLAAAVAYFFFYNYMPLYGIQIAFKDFKAGLGIEGSKWVGFKHFADFFDAYYFPRLMLDTFLLNAYGLLFSFPIPIILAILLNQLEWRPMKKFTQTAIYVPHFVSTVVMAGILYLFLSPRNGIVNVILGKLSGDPNSFSPINFMVMPEWFRPLFIGTDIWQHAGWNTILYIAALTSIDPEIYEAATIDGATKRQKIWHIDIPSLLPIATMMLILNCGSLMSSNTDKALLMQTSGNIATSDIIGVYVYNEGLSKAQFSYTAAINLFVNIINFVMILSVNCISKRVSETSLF